MEKKKCFNTKSLQIINVWLSKNKLPPEKNNKKIKNKKIV